MSSWLIGRRSCERGEGARAGRAASDNERDLGDTRGSVAVDIFSSIEPQGEFPEESDPGRNCFVKRLSAEIFFCGCECVVEREGDECVAAMFLD